jgi:hypothetical protein
MNDFTRDKKIEEISENLAIITKKFGNGWIAFSMGVLKGFGSVLGAGLAIILIGWVLNIIGVIPALKNTTEDLKKIFEQGQQSTTQVLPTPESTTNPAN